MERIIGWVVVMLIIRAVTDAVTRGSGRPGQGSGGAKPGPRQRQDSWAQFREEWQRQMSQARGQGPVRTEPTRPLAPSASARAPQSYVARDRDGGGPGITATGRGSQSGQPRRESYRGSMDHDSGEGETMMYADIPDMDAGQDMSGDYSAAGESSYSHLGSGHGLAGPVAAALATLHSPSRNQAEGAAAGFVLTEILGPPRSRATRRPSAPASRWR